MSGTELSAGHYALARERLCQPIYVGNLPDLGLPAQLFDAIISWHVLEHVPDPHGMLTEARRILVPGGVLIVEVPSIDNPIFALSGESYFPLDCPRHVCFYSRATLGRILHKHGFTIVKEDFRSWHYPERIAKSVAYRPSRLRPNRDLSNRIVSIALGPAVALATGGYLLASAIGAPSEVIRIVATKPCCAPSV